MKRNIRRARDDTWILNRLQGLYEEEAWNNTIVKIYRDAEPKKNETKEESGYMLCPECGETVKTIKKNIGDYAFDKPTENCNQCGWNLNRKRTAEDKRNWMAEGQEKDQMREKAEQACRLLIPQHPPILIWGGGFSPWAYTKTNSNNIWVAGKTLELSRKKFLETISHENAHLSPERKITMGDLTKVKNSEGGSELYYSRDHRLTTDDLELVKANFPDNCVPTWGEKDEFLGADLPKLGTVRNVPIEFDKVAWGAGIGHGFGWFKEFMSYKNQVEIHFNTWINDPNAMPPGKHKYTTYSIQWFYKMTRTNRKTIMKSYNDIEHFGENFYELDEDSPWYTT